MKDIPLFKDQLAKEKFWLVIRFPFSFWCWRACRRQAPLVQSMGTRCVCSHTACRRNALAQPRAFNPMLKWAGWKASIKGQNMCFVHLPFWEYAVLKRSGVSLSFVHRHDVDITTVTSNHPGVDRCSADAGQLEGREEAAVRRLCWPCPADSSIGPTALTPVPCGCPVWVRCAGTRRAAAGRRRFVHKWAFQNSQS